MALNSLFVLKLPLNPNQPTYTTTNTYASCMLTRHIDHCANYTLQIFLWSAVIYYHTVCAYAKHENSGMISQYASKS